MLGGVSLNVRSGRLQHRHRSQRVWLCGFEVDFKQRSGLCFIIQLFYDFLLKSSFSKELDYLFSEMPFNIMDTVSNGFLSQKHRITLYFYITL